MTEWCWTNSQCSPSKSHPTYPQSLKHLQNQFLPKFGRVVLFKFFTQTSLFVVFFASPWPTGFEPTGVLTKSRFRSSGVTELCWTNSQCSPSKSHPKYPQSLKHLQKLSETQILEELFYSNSSHKNHHLLFFCFTLTNRTPVGSNPVGQGEAKKTTNNDVCVKNLNKTTLPNLGRNWFWRCFKDCGYVGWDLDGLHCEFVQHHSVTPLLRNLLFVRTPVGSNPVGQGEAKKQQVMILMWRIWIKQLFQNLGFR